MGYIIWGTFFAGGNQTPSKLPEPFASMSQEEINAFVKSTSEKVESNRRKDEKMDQVFFDFPEDSRKANDDFFTSRGTTKKEFLEYYELSEEQLYK